MHDKEREHVGTLSPLPSEAVEITGARASQANTREGATDRALNRDFARLYEDLRRIVARAVHDPDLASDITAITFERAYSAWVKGNPAALSLAYMKAAAVNVRRDLARTERREARRRTQIRPGKPTTPEQVLQANELLTRMVRAIDCLPPRMRACFVAVELGGQSIEDWARQRGVSRKAVDKNLTAARKRLRDLIGE
jgi:RNA polymerase sigma-70 factor (ECF subfamily)